MKEQPKTPPESYNVNLHDLEAEYADWFEEQSIPVRYFVSMDGGGVNYFTIEFQQQADAVAFIHQFDFRGEPYPWGEKKKSEGWQPYDLKAQLGE
jgi:hypothetical protein